MTEKICTEGHVIDEGKEICSRCGGSAPVVESSEAPVEEAVVNEEAIEVEVPAEEEASEESVEETPTEESAEEKVEESNESSEEAPADEADESPLG